MNGHVVLCIVGDVDKDSISFSDINGWPRKHSIYCNNWFVVAQPAHILHLNLNPKEEEERT